MIDTDKILTYIEDELSLHTDPGEDANWIEQTATYSYQNALLKIRDKIVSGSFD
jgi:hypothetical protein